MSSDPGRDGTKGAFDDAAGALRQKVHDADPETARQWQILRTRIEALPAAAQGSGISAGWIPRWILRPALALGAILLIIVAGRIWMEPSPEVREYATARGERSTVTLPDSSEVILNYASRVRVVGMGESRAIDLRGEAYFRVRKNGTPFVVSTEAGRVEVLGTEFNVRVRENRFEVAVVSGTVRVSAVDTRSRTTVLPAGTMLAVENGEFSQAPEPLPYADFPGWLHRRLQFQRTPVLSVCREIEGMFDVSVAVEAKECSTETISGLLDGRSAESALSAVAQLTGTRVRHDANGYVLY